MVSELFIICYSLAIVITILLIYSKNNKNNCLPFFLLFSAVLVIFAGFNTASPDYIGYRNIALAVGDFYNFYSGGSNELHGDFTFHFISSLINTIGIDIQFVFISIAFISIGITSFVIYKTSFNPMLSLLLFSSHHYLNKDVIQIRAALSSAFLLLAIYLFSKKKKLLGTSSYSLSILSHTSSLVSLPPIFLAHFFKRKYATRLFILFLFLSFFFRIICGGFFGLSNYIEFFLPIGVKNYLNWDIYNYDMGLINLSVIRAILISSALIYFYNKYSQNNVDIIFTFCYVFGTCVLIAFSDFAILSGRLSSMLLSVEFIILINAMSKLEKKRYLLIPLIYSLLLILNNMFFSSYDLGNFEFNLTK